MAMPCRRWCQSSGSSTSCHSRNTCGRRASYSGRQRSSCSVRIRQELASSRIAGAATARAAAGGTLSFTRRAARRRAPPPASSRRARPAAGGPATNPSCWATVRGSRGSSSGRSASASAAGLGPVLQQLRHHLAVRHQVHQADPFAPCAPAGTPGTSAGGPCRPPPSACRRARPRAWSCPTCTSAASAAASSRDRVAPDDLRGPGIGIVAPLGVPATSTRSQRPSRSSCAAASRNGTQSRRISCARLPGKRPSTRLPGGMPRLSRAAALGGRGRPVHQRMAHVVAPQPRAGRRTAARTAAPPRAGPPPRRAGARAPAARPRAGARCSTAPWCPPPAPPRRPAGGSPGSRSG